MNSEWMEDVRRRAAVHAALGDPGRLAIVELLAEGDRSPSDLAAALDVPSNLLAHHAAVLVDAGLVERRRSEGDHRRTYLRLASFESVGLCSSRAAVRPARVVFVCTANSARSQLAAALWQRHSDIPVDSAGTHPGASVASGALAVAQRRNLILASHTPKALRGVLQAGDVVITVCDRAHEELADLQHSHWSVPDPVPHDDAVFDAVFDELSTRITALALRVAPD